MARKKVITPRLKNYIAIVLDRSSSMSDIRAQVIQTFNEIKDTLKQKSALSNQDTYVTLITFATAVDQPLFKHCNVNMIPNLDHASYRPEGWTALFDATAKAIEIFDSVPVDNETSFFIYTITDGEENKSVFTGAINLKRMIVNREDRGNWTFAFQVPKGQKDSFCRKFGVSEDNVAEWEATAFGTQEMSEKTSCGFGNYFDARAKGAKMSSEIFKTTTDLSKVNVKKQLDDLSGKFRTFTVPAESIIKNFVEDKTGKDYIPGTAYYQLVKPEKVQPSKEIVIQEKNTGRTKKIFGGPEARELIGLPQNLHAKVTPGNHGNYDIYVQSKSVNRILPRGTKLLLVKG